MCIGKKHGVYIGFGTIRGFRHPLGVLDHIPYPVDKGDPCTPGLKGTDLFAVEEGQGPQISVPKHLYWPFPSGLELPHPCRVRLLWVFASCFPDPLLINVTPWGGRGHSSSPPGALLALMVSSRLTPPAIPQLRWLSLLPVIHLLSHPLTCAT